MNNPSILALSALVLSSLSFASLEAQEGALRVQQVELSSEFADGRALNPRTTFAPSDRRLYARVHLQNPSRAEGSVRVMLRSSAGQRRASITLNVPPRARYRTLARFPLPQEEGSYEVVVLNAEGETLSTTTLSVQ